MQRIRHTRLNHLRLPLLEPHKFKRRQRNHTKRTENRRLPASRESLEDRILRNDTSKPSFNPLNKRHERTWIFHRTFFRIDSVPGIDPRLLRAREPEPFAVVVFLGAFLEIREGGGVLGVGECFAEGDGDVRAGERRDGETYVGFEGLHDSIAHLIQFKSNMRHYTQETETACCGLKIGLISNSSVHTVGVDVFDCADVVVDRLVAATCAMAYRAIDTSERNSVSH